MNDLSLLLDRLQDGLSLLQGDERSMAEESLSLARLYLQNLSPQPLSDLEERAGRTALEPGTERKRVLIRLGQLSELLGRRRAQAMPYAALTRALIAYIHDDANTKVALLEEADLKLSMYGL